MDYQYGLSPTASMHTSITSHASPVSHPFGFVYDDVQTSIIQTSSQEGSGILTLLRVSYLSRRLSTRNLFHELLNNSAFPK